MTHAEEMRQSCSPGVSTILIIAPGEGVADVASIVRLEKLQQKHKTAALFLPLLPFLLDERHGQP